jgi:hypothetical protein
MRSSSKSNREHWRRAITGALPESIDEPILHRERPLMVVMEVIDPGGGCSVVELEGRGFCLPDEPGDPLRAVEVFLQFFTELAQHGTVAPGAEQLAAPKMSVTPRQVGMLPVPLGKRIILV